MKKYYNISSLYVITINKQKFISECELSDKKYIEVLTKQKYDFDEVDNVEHLSDYYPIFAFMDNDSKEQLTLSINNILQKYISINCAKNVESEFYEEPTSLASIIDDIVEQPDTFYRLVGEDISKEERDYIKSLLVKNCENCINSNCDVEKFNNLTNECVKWENNVIVGQYKVLKLNRNS